jgi:hypothetical protein
MTPEEEHRLFNEHEHRRGAETPSARGVLRAADRLGINLTIDEFAIILSKLGRGYDLSCPVHVEKFMFSYVTDLQPKRILDPSAGFGRLLIPLVAAGGVSEANAITRSPNDLEIGKRFTLPNGSYLVGVSWRLIAIAIVCVRQTLVFTCHLRPARNLIAITRCRGLWWRTKPKKPLEPGSIPLLAWP